jgi:hypothetical protein
MLGCQGRGAFEQHDIPARRGRFARQHAPQHLAFSAGSPPRSTSGAARAQTQLLASSSKVSHLPSFRWLTRFGPLVVSSSSPP